MRNCTCERLDGRLRTPRSPIPVDATDLFAWLHEEHDGTKLLNLYDLTNIHIMTKIVH